jgi:hypothetical protein
MADGHLREQLDRESARVALAPGAAERLFARRARRERRRRIASVSIGLALASASLWIALRGLPQRSPNRKTIPDAATVAGTYEARLSGAGDVARLGLAGRYELRLRGDGSLTIVSPPTFDIADVPTSFSIEGHELRTDLLTGVRCRGDGTYRWSLSDGVLTLRRLHDSCDARVAILTTRPWRPFTSTASDPLEGEWMSSFSCSAMVSNVRSAPVAPHDETFWLRAAADETGSSDRHDPCAGSPPKLSYTFRFTDGRLQIFDRTGAEGFDGRYEVRGDVIVVRDPRTRNISGAYRFAFHLQDERLEFQPLGRAAKDPFYIAVWGTAPFVPGGP